MAIGAERSGVKGRGAPLARTPLLSICRRWSPARTLQGMVSPPSRSSCAKLAGQSPSRAVRRAEVTRVRSRGGGAGEPTRRLTRLCRNECSKVLHPDPSRPPRRLDPHPLRRTHPIRPARQRRRRHDQRRAPLLLPHPQSPHRRHRTHRLLVSPEPSVFHAPVAETPSSGSTAALDARASTAA